MTSTSTYILLMLILLLLSAIFSCSETTFFSLTRAQISRLKSSKKKYAKRVIKLLQEPRETLITILLGNELVNIAFSITVAALVYDIIGEVSWRLSLLVSIIISVPMVLVFGEMLPKNIAIRAAMKLAPVLAAPIRLFAIIVAPARKVLNRIADKMVRLFGGTPSQIESLIMEEEFRQMIDLGFREGVMEEGEIELIHRLFELGNKTVTVIMTPATEMFKVSTENSIEEIVGQMKEVQYHRVPVFQGSPDNIIGVLHSREALRLFRNKQRGSLQDLSEIVRPIHFVRENVTIEKVLNEFQSLKQHLAVVLDDRGVVKGLVTMDDIFRLLFSQKLEWKKEGIKQGI